MRSIRELCRPLPAVLAVGLGACGFPSRQERLPKSQRNLATIDGFEEVRAIDGFPNEAFQESFDACIAAFAAAAPSQSPEGPAGNGRQFPMLVLSSGGVNGAFGAGILTAWSRAEPQRPKFWLVTGVSVGALMAPFVFAGPEFDGHLERLFRHIAPGSMHYQKTMFSSVLWDESLMDNEPLRQAIEREATMELLEAVAVEHESGRRLMVGSTNLDSGAFVVWDLGRIATKRSKEALQLFRDVLRASVSIPVLYPPTLFETELGSELHADGAVVRPLFIPQDVFDVFESAEKAELDWEAVDATLYVIHNGSLRPAGVAVQRDTISIAMRTVTMMSYTMVSEHILHLYMLARAWKAKFRYRSMPSGTELSIDEFTAEDTERLFLAGQGLVVDEVPWLEAPPGYVTRDDLERIAPEVSPTRNSGAIGWRMRRLENAIDRLSNELREIQDKIR